MVENLRNERTLSLSYPLLAVRWSMKMPPSPKHDPVNSGTAGKWNVGVAMTLAGVCVCVCVRARQAPNFQTSYPGASK